MTEYNSFYLYKNVYKSLLILYFLNAFSFIGNSGIKGTIPERYAVVFSKGLRIRLLDCETFLKEYLLINLCSVQESFRQNN